MGLLSRIRRNVRRTLRGTAVLAGGLLTAVAPSPAGQLLGGVLTAAGAPRRRRPITVPERIIGGETLPPAARCPVPRPEAAMPMGPTFRPFGTTFRSGRFPPQISQPQFPVAGQEFQQPVFGGFPPPQQRRFPQQFLPQRRFFPRIAGGFPF